jgi:hypothetical protein
MADETPLYPPRSPKGACGAYFPYTKSRSRGNSPSTTIATPSPFGVREIGGAANAQGPSWGP